MAVSMAVSTVVYTTSCLLVLCGWPCPGLHTQGSALSLLLLLFFVLGICVKGKNKELEPNAS
eukprot:2310216-Prorocentrum_lima.AAC.1